MIVKTKKTQISKKDYIKIAYMNLVKSFWWVLLIPVVFSLFYFIDNANGFWITGLVLLVLVLGLGYLGIWALTKQEQSAMLFQKMAYHIDGRSFSLMMNARQGSQIPWNQIQKVENNGEGFVFYMNRVSFIFIPEKAFNSTSDINFVKALLNKKGLLK